MSAATIDRALRPIREQSGRQRRRPAASALRRSIPVRTSADWDDPAPGFVEADLSRQLSSSRAAALIARMTKLLSSRRTALWSAEWLVTAASKGSKRLLFSLSSIVLRACL
jgi:hypothetical protein